MKNLFIIILLGIVAYASNLTAAEMPPASKPDTELTEDEAELRIGDLKKDVRELEGELSEAKEKYEATRQQITDADKALMDCEKAILAMIEATQADIDAFRTALGEIRNRTRQMQRMSNDELADRRDDVAVLENDLNQLRRNKIALLEEFYQPIIDLAREIKGLYREKKTTTYTVRPWATSRDCLWVIAGRPEILGDPNQWPKLWQANREEIRNPDIIYPGQVLEIPQKGDMDAEAMKLERQYYRNKREQMQAETGVTGETGTN
jgi:nucleoid-associated protein YgaU